MTTNQPHFGIRRSRPWRVVLIALVVLGALALFGPMLRTRLLFRESALIGRTPAEVISRCGEPLFASGPRATDGNFGVPGEPFWGGLDQAGRAQLLASEEFRFIYARGLGDRFSVRFRAGKVVGVSEYSR